MSAKLLDSVRPLTEEERRFLSASLRREQQHSKVLLKRTIGFTFVFFGGIWALGFFLGHPPVLMHIYMTVVTAAVLLWSYVSAKRKQDACVVRLKDALHRNEAHEYRIQAQAMVEFEEEEDEGACYAFQLDHGRIVFICGQDFYPSARFPNTDFSIIEIFHACGFLVEGMIEKRGKKLAPVRIVPAELKRKLSIPEHLETLSGSLDQLEELLAKR